MVPWFKPTAQGGSSIITNGLVSRWTFEDDSDTSTATDTQGNYDGTINGPTYTTTAQEGSHALAHDGVDDDVDYGQISETEAASTFTLVGWGHFRDLAMGSQKYEPLLATRDGWDNYIFLGINTDSGAHSEPKWWSQVESGGTLSDILTTTPSITADAWFHLALVFDSGDLEMFIDGSSAGSDTGGPSQSPDTTDALHSGLLAGVGSAADRYADVIADDLRVYSRALTASEISEIANGNG